MVDREVSPLRLFQERYSDDPWALLVCTICLNLCSGREFEKVHEDLFSLWPDALSMCLADRSELELLLTPLGLQRRRAERIILMSTAYLYLWDGRDPSDLPGIGRYGSDSFRLFVRGETEIPVLDKELRKYLEWKRRR